MLIEILANFCASVIMEVSDRYRIAADRIFNGLVLGFLTSDSTPVKVSKLN